MLMPLLSDFKAFSVQESDISVSKCFHWVNVFNQSCQSRLSQESSEEIVHMGEALRHSCQSFTHIPPLYHFIFPFFLLSFFPVLQNRLVAASELELLFYWCMTSSLLKSGREHHKRDLHCV